jgi:hypothetical protein
MTNRYHNNWGSPVTLSICHHYACPCCNGRDPKDGDGREPAEYSLVIVPSHLRGMNTVPVLRLFEDELESLINLINDTPIGRTDVLASLGEGTFRPLTI